MYGQLLDSLGTLIMDAKYTRSLGGRERTVNVPWIRDEVHVLNGAKYFAPSVREMVELFVERQSEEGLLYDYIFPVASPINYYRHFLPLDPLPPYYDAGFADALSLSNTYDINRGLPTQAMVASIIETYRGLRSDSTSIPYADSRPPLPRNVRRYGPPASEGQDFAKVFLPRRDGP